MLSNDFDGVKIGLEIHCQLTSLNTKMFCNCSSDYRGKPPNTLLCTVCTGLPGALPVLNKRALEAAIKIGLALNCKISNNSNFFRKNYFYPDSPKNYQITQYDKAGGEAIANNGTVETNLGSVRITRIQMEEDPGKLQYEGSITTSSNTLIDYNRAGISLVEIVTEPDIVSPKHAREFLNTIQSIVETIGECDSKLDGSMRADANVSISDGRRVEIKNISSFKEVERALNFEITRQKTIQAASKMETRHWDDVRRVTVTLRVKEDEEGYRYFPDPDLPPMNISENYIDEFRQSLPELPDKRLKRFTKEIKLSEEIARILIRNKIVADYFEETLTHEYNPKLLSGWIATDIMGYLNRNNVEFSDLPIESKELASLAKSVSDSKINDSTAKAILLKSLSSGTTIGDLLKSELDNLVSFDDLPKIIDTVISDNPKALEDAKNDPQAIHFLIGQVMKVTKGRANHSKVKELIETKLK
ncbi:MAG: Asp-tRNA(Asn)/Glu-tRNA(Gln) amidotransferase GatCAB subunit B [Thaumarchaeota archaeon]|nr:Asp-tRNA(Asn)/Glu-tRNA(Gln) amidotransferase GatCAB subunit B [Nitrososphaerota archaeon]|tara:strand:+ start:5794 stop:7212 length:1419 start_codon:yes stop_codon:yes gene_type:complete